MVLEGTSALAAECLGAKCQANNHAGKEMKSKLCCKCRHQTHSNFIYHSGPPVFTPSLGQFCKLRHMHDKGTAS